MRVQTEDGWWLLRASNTQAVLVARAEATTEAGLERLKAGAGATAGNVRAGGTGFLRQPRGTLISSPSRLVKRDTSPTTEAIRADPVLECAYVLCVFNRRTTCRPQQITGGLAVTATWEARDGEADTVADILARFAPQARQEPGTKMFLVHRAVEQPCAVSVLRTVRGRSGVRSASADAALQGADRRGRRAAAQQARAHPVPACCEVPDDHLLHPVYARPASHRGLRALRDDMAADHRAMRRCVGWATSCRRKAPTTSPWR